MKKVVFKYFDVFCYGELIEDEKDPDWVKPMGQCKAFGYSIKQNIIFYDGKLEVTIKSMFSIGRKDFIDYLSEWFKTRYNLPVSVTM